MKKIIILNLLLFISLSAQYSDSYKKVNPKHEIIFVLQEFEKGYISQNSNLVKNSVSSTLYTEMVNSSTKGDGNTLFTIDSCDVFEDKNEAIVTCNISIYDKKTIIEKITCDIQLSYANRWIIEDIGVLDRLDYSFMNEMLSVENENTEEGLYYSDVELIQNSDVFSRRTFNLKSSSEIITRSYVKEHLGSYLLSKSNDIDFASIHACFPEPLNQTLFMLDKQWKRIVMAKRNCGDLRELRSYGDREGDEIKFVEPVAIVADYFRHIFVLDRGLKKVLKFYYNYDYNTLTYIQGFNFEGVENMVCPTDIEITADNNEIQESSQKFLIADEGAGKIYEYNYLGGKENTYRGYKQYYNSPLHEFSPSRICATGGWIGVVDERTNMFIGGMRLGDCILLDGEKPLKFPRKCHISEITSMPYSGFMISDNSLGAIHIVDRFNKYYGTFINDNGGGQSLFGDFPRTSDFSYSTRPYGYYLLTIQTFDGWSESQGIREFVKHSILGAVNEDDYGENICLRYSFSCASSYNLWVYNVTDGYYVAGKTGQTAAGTIEQTFLLDKSLLEPGKEYKWTFMYHATFDDEFKTVTIPVRNYYELPEQINSSTQISGEYICNNTVINSGATVNIAAGSKIYMMPGAEFIVKPNSKLVVNGTADNPVEFLRRNVDEEWKQVKLEGDNNQFTYCKFDGGLRNVEIVSTGNKFTNCEFLNATDRGVSSYYKSPSQHSTFELNNCSVHHNGGHGVLVYYSDASIQNTEIHSNGESGIFFKSCKVGYNGISGKTSLFRNNKIYNNRVYGLYLYDAVQLWLGYGNIKGNNDIYNNGSHEIYIFGNYSRILQSLISENGSKGGIYGKIFDAHNTSGFYVYNLAKSFEGHYYVPITQMAENNYWGNVGGPLIYNFYGAVDYTPYLTSYTLGSDKRNGEDGTKINVVSSKNMIDYSSDLQENNPEFIENNNVFDRMLNLYNLLNNSIPDNKLVSKLFELYSLSVDYDPLDNFKMKKRILDICDRYASAYLNSGNNKGVKSGNTSFLNNMGEQALLVNLYEKLSNSSIQEVLDYINEIEPLINIIENRLLLLNSKITIYELSDNKEELIKTINEIEYLFDQPSDKDIIFSRPSLDVFYNNLSFYSGISRASNNPEKLLKDQTNEIPTEFGLSQNYPNPFNPTTSLKVSIPEPSKVRVEVFDITGSLVKVINDQDYKPGIYEIKFNASAFASGVYFARCIIESNANNQIHSFVKKMVLIK